jgi:hypothetical protein
MRCGITLPIPDGEQFMDLQWTTEKEGVWDGWLNPPGPPVPREPDSTEPIPLPRYRVMQSKLNNKYAVIAYADHGGYTINTMLKESDSLEAAQAQCASDFDSPAPVGTT